MSWVRSHATKTPHNKHFYTLPTKLCSSAVFICGIIFACREVALLASIFSIVIGHQLRTLCIPSNFVDIMIRKCRSSGKSEYCLIRARSGPDFPNNFNFYSFENVTLSIKSLPLRPRNLSWTLCQSPFYRAPLT